MTTASVNGERLASARIRVPFSGPWIADVVFEGAPTFSDRPTILLGGNLELVGTFDPRNDGTRGEQRFARIVGGANGWGSVLPVRHYHNDAGVRGVNVATDAAREAGEVLADFDGVSRLGIDYVRGERPASEALEMSAGDRTWWVGYDGLTVVGNRAEFDAVDGSYEVLEVDPANRCAVLGVDDLRNVRIGNILSERLDTPLVVRDMLIDIQPDSARVYVWGGETSRLSRAASIFQALTRRSEPEIFGVSKYRVVRMVVDRVDLQAVRARSGLPNLLTVSMFPGFAGVHAVLTPGAEVLVQFIDGDPTQPIVTHFAGRDGAGWAPVSLTLDASTEIKLGASASGFVAMASAVGTELTKIKTTLDSLAGATFGTPYLTPASVAASKVKAQ